MINMCFWKKIVTNSNSVDEEFFKAAKRFQLKSRVINSIKHTTNWQLRLRNFLTNNKNNQKLIIDVAGYYRYLKDQGVDDEQAAKECLEMFHH